MKLFKNNEAKQAMEMATEEVVKKGGLKPIGKIGLATLIVGAGYALVKGVLVLIENKWEQDAIVMDDADQNEAADADFEPAEEA